MLCSVGIRPPGIEVRFKDIFIETSVYTNVSRNLPSIFNAYRGAVEVSTLHRAMGCSFNACEAPADALIIVPQMHFRDLGNAPSDSSHGSH